MGRWNLHEAYTANRQDANALTLDAAPLADALLEFVSTNWSGTATDLLESLDDCIDENRRKTLIRAKAWPTTPQSMSAHLRRLAPNLRAAGLVVDFAQVGHERRRVINLERIRNQSSASSASSATGRPPCPYATNVAEDDCASDRGSSAVAFASDSASGSGFREIADYVNGADDDLHTYSDSTRCSVCGRGYEFKVTDQPGWIRIRCRCEGGAWKWTREDDPALIGGAR